MTIHTVIMGDSLQTIARRYGVAWQEIAEANNLLYPYIDSENVFSEYKKNDHIAKIGTQLLIPTTNNIVSLSSSNSITNIGEQVLGSDLDCFTELYSNPHNMEDGGMLTDDGKGDIKLASGVPNLAQQILIKLQTEFGSLHLHPRFGTHIVNYIGRRKSQELLTKIALEIRESIMKDPRVEDMSEITMLSQSTVIHVSFIVYPVAPYSSFVIESDLNI